MDLLVLALGAVLVSNVLLSQFLGICSFVGVSKKRSSALGMGLAVMFVLLMSSAVTWIVYNFILDPLKIEFLYIIVFILIIATLVQLCEMFMKKYMSGLYKVLGIYLPLITTNCAIMGVATQNMAKGYNFIEAMVYALGIGAGYILVMYMFSAIRERLEASSIPKPFKGVSIALITAGIMAMAFAGLGGVF